MTPEQEAIDDVIERVNVDAYGDEGHEAFLCAFDDEIAYPIRAHIAGTDVDVARIDYDGHARRGLMAKSKRTVTGIAWRFSNFGSNRTTTSTNL